MNGWTQFAKLHLDKLEEFWNNVPRTRGKLLGHTAQWWRGDYNGLTLHRQDQGVLSFLLSAFPLWLHFQ